MLPAAEAAFCCPPVSFARAPGGLHIYDSCMVAHKGWFCAFIDWHRQKPYPHLVLQRSPRVTVAAHSLVAELFLGPRDKGQVCCHRDVVVPDRVVMGLDWCSPRLHEYLGQAPALFPKPARCISKGCVSALCVFWDTQSSNAKTGSRRGQVKQRRRHAKLACL